MSNGPRTNKDSENRGILLSGSAGLPLEKVEARVRNDLQPEKTITMSKKRQGSDRKNARRTRRATSARGEGELLPARTYITVDGSIPVLSS